MKKILSTIIIFTTLLTGCVVEDTSHTICYDINITSDYDYIYYFELEGWAITQNSYYLTGENSTSSITIDCITKDYWPGNDIDVGIRALPLAQQLPDPVGCTTIEIIINLDGAEYDARSYTMGCLEPEVDDYDNYNFSFDMYNTNFGCISFCDAYGLETYYSIDLP